MLIIWWYETRSRSMLKSIWRREHVKRYSSPGKVWLSPPSPQQCLRTSCVCLPIYWRFLHNSLRRMTTQLSNCFASFFAESRKLIFSSGKKRKSIEARSGLYGGCSNTSKPGRLISRWVYSARCPGALSWFKITLSRSIFGRFFLIAFTRSRLRIWKSKTQSQNDPVLNVKHWNSSSSSIIEKG